MTLRRAAPAKINLFLEVLGRRRDGFHDLLTLMHKIALHDTLTISPRNDGDIRLVCDDPSLPTDERNLVVRAALLLQVGCDRLVGADISLSKRIPVGAGLGGGSSDAATTLLGLNELWDLRLSAGSLHRLASMLGSDVAFFLGADFARCEGRGDIIKPLPALAPMHLVVLWPGIAVDTATVYRSSALDLDDIRMLPGSELDYARSIRVSPPFNRLRVPCIAEYPEVARALLKAESICAPRPVGLSGSGSSIFVAVDGADEASDLAEMLRKTFSPPCVVEVTSTLCTPIVEDA